MSDLIKRLHDCKRGLTTATPRDYNDWWRQIAALEAKLSALRPLIKIMAEQKTSVELVLVDGCEEPDYEYGYDTMVENARNLKRIIKDAE